MPSDSGYSIADVSALLSQRVGLDLSPVELAEILWLALQRGVVVPEETEVRRSPTPPTPEPESEPPEPPPTTPSSSPAESIPIVAEPPEPNVSETREDSNRDIGPALPINIPETVALRNRQAIARSLRPLMRKVASKQRRVLDEEATVIQVAETQTWSPIEKPEPERWLELAIVIEVTNLLDVWQDTIAEFQQLMERHGAFRNVRTWQLKPNAQGEPQLFLQISTGLRGSPRSPRELLDAGGQRQILLLSDCTSRAWRMGKIPKLLKLWSRENPVAIVQLLPEHYWDRSALKASYPVALRSRRPGALSRDWIIEGLSTYRRQQLPAGLKLPVVTIHPESLGQWARAIAASNNQPTTGVIFNPRNFQAPPSTPQTSPLTAKQLVQRFRNTASAQAQELADMMAVLPVNWSVIRLIQKNWVQKETWQQTGALYLAEIFLSGLLRPVSAESKLSPHQTPPQYYFVEGVRDVLLGTIPISEAWTVGEEVAAAVFKQLPTEVQERVNADIERRYGDALSYFEAFLIPDLPWGDSAAAEIFPFAQITRQVLQRWGGVYAELATELGRRESSSINETRAYPALEQQLDFFQQEILDDFIQREHRFDVHFPNLRYKDALAEPDPEQITLVEGEDISVVILNRILTETSEDSVTFELAVRINFAVEISYPDYDQYVPELETFLSTNEVKVPNQTVDGVAAVALSFFEEDEVEPELVELRINQPILIDPTRRQVDSFQIPPLQTFEFEVATIEVEQPISETVTMGSEVSSVSLTPFEFEFTILVALQESIEISNIDKVDADEILAILSEEIRIINGQRLNTIKREIFRRAWMGQSYEDIAVSLGYTKGYLRDEGSVLFRILSEMLRVRVTKANFRTALESWLVHGRSESAGMLTLEQRGQAQQFVENLGNDVALEMVLIPGGTFLMGSPPDELQRSNNEGPQHPVTVPPFLISKYPITQRQWQVIAALPQVNRPLEPDPSHFKGADRPVENVSWFDAVEFCDRLSQLTSRPYHLPTEAEWEYACRAGTTTPFHFGETITTDLANYNGNSAYGNGPQGIYRAETTPVSTFPANAFGLYDMHGNVWEWCQDHYHSNYESAPTDGSAWIDENAEKEALRMTRGGSWNHLPRNCRSASRHNLFPSLRNPYIGFRIVCSAQRTL